MATETTKIVVETEVKGTGKVQASLKDLKFELKELRDAQGYIKEGSKAWEGLTKSINEVEGKIGDLNDAFNTLRGSGVERVNASVGLFKEGLFSFDFGKIGIALKGLGAAFKAVLPFAIIEGFKMLYENWDEIVKVLSKLIPALDSTSKVTHELEKVNSKLLEVNRQINAEYENEIILLEAIGGKEKEVLEIKGKILSNDIKQLEVQALLARSKELDARLTETLYEKTLKAFNLQILADDSRNKRIKEVADETDKIELELSKKRTEASANRINAIDLEIKKTKEHGEAVVKKMLDDAKADDDHKTKHTEYIKREQEKIDKENERIRNNIAGFNAQQDAKIAAIKADRLEEEKIEADRAKLRSQMRDQEIAEEKKANAEMVASWEKAEADKHAATEAGFKNAILVTQNLQAISDLAFSLRTAKVKKGSAEEEALMKRQFEINKGLQIAQTTISTITGAREAYKSLAGIPIVGVGLGIAAAAAASIAGLAAIQKIRSTKFESASTPDIGGGGFSSGSSNSAPQVSHNSAPSIQPFTKLDESGRNLNINVKADVYEGEMTAKQNRVNRLQDQATFG